MTDPDDLDEIFESMGELEPVDEFDDFVARHGDGEGGFDPLLSALGAQPDQKHADLSAEELRFAVLVANSGEVTASYTQVFDTEGLEKGQIYNFAAKLARKRRVSDKIAEIRAQIAKTSGIGVSSLVALVEEAVEMGRQQQDPKVILSAVDKLSGLLGLGENQKRKDTQNVVVMLDDETRRRMLNQLVTLQSDMIDVTPTQEVPE